MGAHEDTRDLLPTALELIRLADERGLSMRLMGSLAVPLRCPDTKHLRRLRQAPPKDMDFAARRKDLLELTRLFADQGYLEDPRMGLLHGPRRRLFVHRETGMDVDLFLDSLECCHRIDFASTLETDPHTLPLEELLLGKLQMVEPGPDDLLDAACLVLQLSMDASDRKGANIPGVVRTCARHWGLWRTVTANLELLREYVAHHPGMSSRERTTLDERIRELERAMHRHPKSLKWKLRNLVGERWRWYSDVSELDR